MEPQTILEKILDFILYKIPCWLGGHFYTRKLENGEKVSISGFENKEYTCEKCGKKTIL